MHRLVITILLTAALQQAICAPASAQVTLSYRWTTDDVQRHQFDDSIRQTIRIFGAQSTVEIEHSGIVARRAEAKTVDGSTPLSCQYEKLELRLSQDNAVRFSFDSDQPNGEDPLQQLAQLRKLLTAQASTNWTTVLDEDQRVASVTGFETMLTALEPNHVQRVEAMFDSEYLVQTEAARLHDLPTEPIEPGHEWQTSEEIRMSSGESLTLDRRYIYSGTEVIDGKELHAISITVESASWAVTSDDDADREVIPGDLEVLSSEGRLLFDQESGRIESCMESISLQGPIEIELENATGMATLVFELEFHEAIATEGE